ncbi:ABC transporter permease [Luedemannella flava]|uniref:ABC transporter permease n=1 Tax=Luedemannella flava TaxID=349316 RepID=A0ABN2LZN6_9ACTN
MPKVIATRVAAMVVVLFALTVIVFVLQKASPLDPVHAMLGAGASQQAVERQRHALGLDRPVPEQYAHYVTGLLRGDFGTSYRTRRPVGTDLGTFVPATAELALYGLILALLLAVLLAVATTLRWWGAGVVRFVLLAGASTPAFLVGIGVVLLFYQQLGWLPAAGRTSFADAPAGPTGLLTIDGLLVGRPDVSVDALAHLLLPALAVAIGPAVSIGRVLRSSLLGNATSDFARTARAKGLTESRVLRRHLLRNSVGPALSMTGLQVGLMFAGVLVIEQVFAWPGIGQYTAQSIPFGDFPAIAGVTLLLGAGYIVINTVVDVLQAIADPRITV